MTIQTNTHYNFDKAENDVFSWSYWDGTSGRILTHKATDRQIYQMHWLNEKGKMSDKVEGDVREQALMFWSEFHAIQKEREAQMRKESTERFLSEVDDIAAEENLMRKMDDPNSDY